MPSHPAPDPAIVSPTESPEQREARIRYEAALIAKAEADIDAGLGIDGDDLDAWLDQLETDPDAPMPQPRRQKP